MDKAVPDKLLAIVEYKKLEVLDLRSRFSEAALLEDARHASPARGFAKRMTDLAAVDSNALICELKRRSPSAGDINLERSPVDAARAYETGGAACISVLTDGPSFGGSLKDMIAVREAVSIPVLRKDFMIDAMQILEARAHGADAILLIMAILDDELARDLHQVAVESGMSVLLETHDEEELDRALDLPSPLVGVNNRDLRTFTTDLRVTERLARLIPADKLLISESGVATGDDIGRLRKCGARGFLIGETLMRAENPSATVASLASVRN